MLKQTSLWKLVPLLLLFVAVGSGMMLFIWETFSAFLDGDAVSGGAFLLAMMLVAAFLGLGWLLGRALGAITSGD